MPTLDMMEFKSLKNIILNFSNQLLVYFLIIIEMYTINLTYGIRLIVLTY